MKNDLNTRFQQKFATGSYGVGIGHAWCSRKASEICSSLVQKKKLKKNYFSSHKLPKQQSTSFWSQGILGVKRQVGSSLRCTNCGVCISLERKVCLLHEGLDFHSSLGQTFLH
jgi:hypothetical protein